MTSEGEAPRPEEECVKHLKKVATSEKPTL